MAKRVETQRLLGGSHTGHANHLCELVSKRKMEEVAKRAAGAKYICYICGRAAAEAESLCEPVEI